MDALVAIIWSKQNVCFLAFYFMRVLFSYTWLLATVATGDDDDEVHSAHRQRWVVVVK